VTEAVVALNKGDVIPVLKWVKEEDEDEISAVFEKALSVRSKGPEAQEIADRYFFESLIRLHRAAEGAPFTGVKAADNRAFRGCCGQGDRDWLGRCAG
jgi:hypothetical protein